MPLYHILGPNIFCPATNETISQILISIYFTLVLVSQEWSIAQAVIFPEGIFRFATHGLCSNILSIRKICAQSLSYPRNLALNLVFEAINEALPQQFMNLIKMYCYLTEIKEMKQENLAWSFTEFNMAPYSINLLRYSLMFVSKKFLVHKGVGESLSLLHTRHTIELW